MSHLPMLNRSVVIVRPKKPFFDWLRTLPDPISLSPEQYDDDSAAYLLPDVEDDNDQEKALRQCYEILFEELLSGWWTLENDWPKERSFLIFKEWFTCEFHSLALDLVDGPLVLE